jgi:U3 small nucleolar RNA-associated protein 14
MGRRGKTTGAKPAKPPKTQPKVVEEINESDDEEIDEDEAFNSEDERMYGHFFEVKKDGDDNSDDEDDASSDDDDDDDDDDGGQYMLDLLNNLDKPGAKNDDVQTNSHMAGIPESEFSSKKTLTLDNLMEGIQDTQGFKTLQKTFKKELTATATPLEKVKADRAGRKISYKEQVKNISGWTNAVQENRQAESLDFKPKERLELTRDTLIDKFEPATDFEKELEQALEEAGQKDEEAVLKAEEQALQDDLGANRLTLEEYKKRRGQLAQVRALMFSYEQKRHHMKKIKSKKYRRIRKKQRERLKDSAVEAAVEADEDFADELKEKEEVARIQERMTLAHKNTSKWAKRVLKRGKNVDMETRRALSAQLKRGDDLRQKMMGEDSGSDEDDDEEDLVESARRVLADTENSTDATHGKMGLFKLSFMQKGIQKQRELAKEEARKLLNELESNAQDDFDDMMEEEKEDEFDGKKTPKIASVKEMKQVLQDGELMASSLEFGKSSAIATSGGIQIDLSDNEDYKSESKEKTPAMKASGTSEHSSTMVVSSNSNKKEQEYNLRSRDSKTKTKNSAKQVATTTVADDDEANPWIRNSCEAGTEVNAEASAKTNKNKRGVVDIESAVDMLDAGTKRASKGKEDEGSKPETSAEKKLTSMTQEELVRRAFSAPSDKEVEEEFLKEKEDFAAEEDPTRKVAKEGPKEVAGWGSWTGRGALPPPPRRKLPKKLQAPIKRKEPRKRKDDFKPDVIINQKRLKKTANTFMLGDVPHPYSSRAEYEETMLGGVGQEWNVTGSYKSLTRPEILTRSGKIIQPISKKVKVARAPAKF